MARRAPPQGELGIHVCGGRGKHTVPVGAFKPNAFGLHDMHGNVSEWVEDCWHHNYTDAPSDGSAWATACTDVGLRVVRGGSWNGSSWVIRAAVRDGYTTDHRNNGLGFRVARTLSP